jgi:hypothetical protein
MCRAKHDLRRLKIKQLASIKISLPVRLEMVKEV